jgi:thioredoxin-dependent peroxiredoxin
MHLLEARNEETMLEVGSKAPDFTLADQNGTPVRLTERTAKHVVVLFFYPKDNSAGCTVEACAFRDSYEDFQDAGAEVIGVSSGTIEDKQKFIRNNRLPFTLLNDPDGSVESLYGIEKGFLGLMPGRITYVIDREGVIRHKFESRINMDAHVTEALKVVKSLAQEQRKPVATR